MKRIEKLFIRLKSENRKALATFVTAGDPDIVTTGKLVHAMVRSGADIIELGIPYSDPIAEGAVIQEANVRALKNDVSVPVIMKLVKALREEQVDTPILFLLYYNVVFQYGVERFLSECVSNGVDGLIVPDLPFEEQGEIRPFCEKYKIDLITMVSPVSEERIEKLVKNAEGFLYCVSSLGVTGVRSRFQTDFESFMAKVSKYSNLPRLIGFGVSTPEQVLNLKKYSEGLIVGSAIVKKIDESTTSKMAVESVENFVKSLRDALK
jgi:tryptophan synthase alpha chain